MVLSDETQRLASTALRILFTRGPWHLASRAVRWIRLRRSCAEFDARFGLDTARRIEVSGLRYSGQFQGEAYQPTPPVIFNSILRQLPLTSENYTFVDLGCGKGTTLLLAAALPFQRIVGVEFASDLYLSALRNVERYRAVQKDCRAIEVISQDVANFTFPEEPLVVYLFNPFGTHVMTQVLHNLRVSMARKPRDIWVLYVHPVLKEQLDQCHFLDLQAEGDTIGGITEEYAIYRASDASDPGNSHLAPGLCN